MISASQRNKANLLVKDMQFFISYGSWVSAYKVLFPRVVGKQKCPEMVCYIWSKFNSKERAKLKQTGKNIRMSAMLHKMKVRDGI